MTVVLVFTSIYNGQRDDRPAGVIIIEMPHVTMYDLEPAIDAHFMKAWHGHQGLKYDGSKREFKVIVGGAAPYEAHFSFTTFETATGGVTTWTGK